MAKRNTPADAELDDFAAFLAEVFGNRTRGLLAILRKSVVWQRWRAGVEWCPRCRRFAPLNRKSGRRMGAYDIHSTLNGDPCPASGHQARWSGDSPAPEDIVTGTPLVKLSQEMDAHATPTCL